MTVRISGTKKNIRWQKMAHNCYYVYIYQGTKYYIPEEIFTTDVQGYNQGGITLKCTAQTPILDDCTPTVIANKISDCQVTGDNQVSCSNDASSECLKYGWTTAGAVCYCPKTKPSS